MFRDGNICIELLAIENTSRLKELKIKKMKINMSLFYKTNAWNQM